MKIQNTKGSRGFTLLELMIGSAILIVALAGLLAAFIGCLRLNETAKNLTIAINGAQEKLEEIRNYNFNTMVGAYSPGGSQGNTFTIDPANWLAAENQRAVIYILNPQTGAILNTSPLANPGLALYEVRIAVCWRQSTGRLFGEDDNLNGTLNIGEDDNSNGYIDSPGQLVTLIAER